MKFQKSLKIQGVKLINFNPFKRRLYKKAISSKFKALQANLKVFVGHIWPASRMLCMPLELYLQKGCYNVQKMLVKLPTNISFVFIALSRVQETICASLGHSDFESPKYFFSLLSFKETIFCQLLRNNNR